MTLVEALAQADTYLDSISSDIDTLQQAYFGDNSHYCQLLRSHTDSNQPTDGGTAQPDHLDSATADGETWRNFYSAIVGQDMPVCVAIDDDGDSYTFQLQLVYDDTLYLKGVQIGADTGNNQDWTPLS